MVMPPPMVPAPITPTRAMGRSIVPSGRPGTLAAARSAWNTWRSARDSGVCISAWNSVRSVCRPSSKGLSEAATASTHCSGAGKGLLAAATVLRANCRKASALGCLTFRSRARGSGSPRAATWAA